MHRLTSSPMEEIKSKILSAEAAVLELSIARRKQKNIISTNIRHLEKVRLAFHFVEFY